MDKIKLQYYGTDRHGFKMFSEYSINQWGVPVRTDYKLIEYPDEHYLSARQDKVLNPDQVEVLMGC